MSEEEVIFCIINQTYSSENHFFFKLIGGDGKASEGRCYVQEYNKIFFQSLTHTSSCKNPMQCIKMPQETQTQYLFHPAASTQPWGLRLSDWTSAVRDS